MSIQTIELGPCPSDEDCAQVGKFDFERISALECAVYVRQLHRMIDRSVQFEQTGKVRVCVKTFEHEMGAYREVVVKFDDEDPIAVDIAFSLEGNLPKKWDTIALSELENSQAEDYLTR